MEKIKALGALAALAQETRLDIFRRLVEVGPRGLPAGVIGDQLKLPSATLSCERDHPLFDAVRPLRSEWSTC